MAQKAAAPTGRPAKAQAHGFEWVHGWAPQVTVLTSPDASHIVFQLPGVRPGARQANARVQVTDVCGLTDVLATVRAEDLRLRLEGRRLTISGRRVRAIAFRRPAAASRELAVERPGQWPARRLLPGPPFLPCKLASQPVQLLQCLQGAAVRPSLIKAYKGGTMLTAPCCAAAGVRSKEPVQQGPSTVVHRGDFSAAWALPAGDLSRLRARFADERLYLTLPA